MEGIRSARSPFGNELSYGGDKIVRNFHDRLSLIIRGSFIFCHCLFLGLFFVVS